MNTCRISRRSLLAALPLARLAAQNDTTFSADVKVVNVLVTVRNKQGQLLNNLTKEDFVLAEDGRPQTIRYFSRETDLPLTLGLLVDTSGSVRQVIGQERGASHVFLEDVLRQDKDQAFILHFDREVELLQDLTNSREKLLHAVDLLEVGQTGGRPSGGGYPRGDAGQYPGGGRGRGGGTLLYDAIYLASNELLSKQKGRKAVVVLSDGKDNGSKESIYQAIESAQRADTLVYSILFTGEEAYPMVSPGLGGYGRRRGGLGGPMPRYPQSSGPDGKKVLQQLSRETGGNFFAASKKESIDKIYARIQEELRNQYSLGYTSDQASGSGYRKISLSVKQKDSIVQARDGYYPDAR